MVGSNKSMGPSFAVNAAIRHAFVMLLFDRRFDEIRVGDIIDIAGVGRSTFYNHFKSKEDVLLAVIEPIFTPLAAAAAGEVDRNRLVAVLEHVWEQRATGRLIFAIDLMPRLQRKLAGMIQERLPKTDGAPSLIVATGLAASQLAMLQQWISGAAPCPPTILAATMTAQCPRASTRAATECSVEEYNPH